MKRIPLLLLAFFAVFQANAQIVNIRTDRSSWIIRIDADGRLNTLHYGAAIDNPEALANYANGVTDTHGTPYETYPTQGERNFNEPALAVTHRNGDLNTVLRYVSHETRAIDDNVSETTIHLKDALEGIEVDLVYTAYQKQDVILSHSVIRNTEKGAIKLRSYYSSALPIMADKFLLTHLYGSWAHEDRVENTILDHGTKSIESRKGLCTAHSENPAFMLSLNTEQFSENSGEVIAGTLAWSGNFKLNFELTEFHILNVLAGINPYAGEYTLDKGESFTTPDVIWTWSGEGAGQASRNLHRWARNYWLHNGSNMTPTLLNSWEGAYYNFTTKTLTDMIDDAAEMGLEMFVLDDGWFGRKYPRNSDSVSLGDWQPNLTKIPEGIDYVASHAHEKGIKFGLWIEPEMISPKSELFEKHPDWIVADKLHEAPLRRTQYVLDLTNPAVQDFVFETFDSVMKLSDKIDYIKWDANRIVESVGSDYLDEQPMFWVKYTQGFYKVMERIREKYPKVLIQACASGGGRVEYGNQKYFDEVWTSDNTEALVRTQIQYGFSLFYPACIMGSHVSAVPSHQTQNVTPIKFRFDIAAAGRLGMELQPKSMTEEERQFAKRAIASYKGYRDIIMNGDLYRLGSPYDDIAEYAILYVSEDKERAVLFVYRTAYENCYTAKQIRLEGLDAQKNYLVTELNVDRSSSWFSGKVLPGSLLMAKGINPPLQKVYESGVFLLEAK
jgi:alpha-galactosidase